MPFLTGSLLQLFMRLRRLRQKICFYALFNGQSVATMLNLNNIFENLKSFYALFNGQSVATRDKWSLELDQDKFLCPF